MTKHKLKQNILASFCATLLLLSTNSNYVLANNSKLAAKNSNKIVAVNTIANTQIPKQLENDIKQSLANLYGPKNVDDIYANILKIIAQTKNHRSISLKQADLSRSSDWYKNEVIYMLYADEFGVKDKNSKTTFKDLTGMLDYLKDLGVTTIYILPFMDSPMGDAGFDVRDPQNVRADLGGTKEFKEFAAQAQKRGLKINADLILNHFSDQHKWFQDILKGDTSKLNYFVVLDHPPKYKKYFDKKIGAVVDYQEDDGTITHRRLIFPDICENNYRKITVNGKDYYIYHTFYPFQLDVNWKNPQVLYYMLNTIGYWANNGVDIFRMDAIPFFVKDKGTWGENLPETHDVITILSSFVQTIGPKSVLQAEACQWPKDILPYFGKEHTIKLAKNKELTRTNQVQLAYNFPYMPAIWASLLTENNKYFWQAYQQTPPIPDTASWVTFLRVHDELTLEMVDVKTRKLLYKKLIKNGAEFRKGFGVSGRVANFLDNNPQRINLAYSVLLSLPGTPVIYYGDEIGAQNNWDYAKQAASIRETTQKAKNKDLDVLSYFDSRDINRGPVEKISLYNAMETTNTFSGEIYHGIKKLIEVRKENPVMTRGSITQIEANQKDVFKYLRATDKEKVLVINNLSGHAVNVKLKVPNCNLNDTNSLKDLISGEQIKIEAKPDQLKLELKPYQSLWLKF